MENNYYMFMFNTIQNMINLEIPEEEKRKIMSIFKCIKLNKKEFFLREGDIPNRIGFNVSGILRSYYIDRKGNDITKLLSFEGSFFSYAGFILKEKSNYYIECLEDCILLVSDYKALEKLIEDNIWGLRIIKNIQDNILLYKERRESSFLIETAKDRYKNFKNNNPDVERRVNQKYIASYLGISPESLSRIRKQLKNS